MVDSEVGSSSWIMELILIMWSDWITTQCLLSILNRLLEVVELIVMIPLWGMKQAFSPPGWGESFWLKKSEDKLSRSSVKCSVVSTLNCEGYFT